MGSGGVLAGGCTVGAGLAGIPTLSFAALFALLSVIFGAVTVKSLIDNLPNYKPSFAY